jgi:hypothetical protein
VIRLRPEKGPRFEELHQSVDGRQCGSNAALRRFDRGLEAFGSKKWRDRTGLEPAASCVTGRRSNPTNYAQVMQQFRMICTQFKATAPAIFDLFVKQRVDISPLSIDLASPAGVELFRILITRNLLIQGTARPLKRPRCPIHCTFIVRKYSCTAIESEAHLKPSIPQLAVP